MNLFDGTTPEEIRDRILGRIGTVLQTREGSFAFDVVAPVAFEIWRQKMTLEEFLTAFYVDENSGRYLDPHAYLVGLGRRQGTKAMASMSFTGRDGVTIPAGTAFFSAGGLEFDLTEDITIQNGTAVGNVQAADVGEVYNVNTGEINQTLRNVSGVDSYINDAATGGTDPEADSTLFSRICEKRENPTTSSNEAHYRQWALEVNGVGDCRVDRLWAGNGTVRVLLVGYDYDPVDAAVVSAVAENIEAKRAVGARVTVVSAEGVLIDVAATLTVDTGTTVQLVQESFRKALAVYLQETVAEKFRNSADGGCTIYVNRIAALLMGIEGVIDYSNLTVNGSADNLELDNLSVPVVGEVMLE